MVRITRTPWNAWLRQLEKNSPTIASISCFQHWRQKNVDEMLQQLLTIPKAEIYLTTFDFPKAIHLSDDYQQLNEARISIVSLWQFGLAELLEKMTNEDLLLITGSLYFVSEVRELLLGMGGRNG